MFTIDRMLIIIVLYKQKLKDSLPYRSITDDVHDLGLQWYVYDNSPVADKEAGNLPFVKYIHDPANPGVSTAYNRGAEYARLENKEWLLLFDQDTKPPVNFINVLQQEIGKSVKAQLYAMRLYKGDALISPSGYEYKRGYMLGNIENGKRSLKNITFLNSGLLVSLELFTKAGGFDQNVPLYFSDFVFINRVRAVIKEFTLLPISLAHDLSSNDMSNPKDFKVRYDLYLKGISEAIKSEYDGSFFYQLTALLRALKLTLNMKDLYYLKSYWKYLVK